MTAQARGVPRWVLDTNVVLSALIRPGATTGRLRLAWQARLFVPLINRITIAELVRVLGYPKFRLAPEQQHDLLADYIPWAEVVPMPATPPTVRRCRDPFDVPFLRLVAVAKADALVSGDADLLTLASPPRLTILTPAQAVEWLSG
jgi:putative PIN family toxin of toxin-antitoxin system